MPAERQALWVEHMVEDKDTAVSQLHLDRERQYSELSDATTQLANSMRMHRVARQHLRDEVRSTKQDLEERFASDIQQERRSRQASATQLERLTGEVLEEVHASIAEEAGLQAGSERYAEQVRDEICHLYSDLEQARRLRIEAGQRLAEGVKVKLGEVRDAVTAEQRLRMDSQGTLLELFGQMGEKLDQEIEGARRERREATDRLIGLMERVLPRMDEMWRKGLDACREGLQEHVKASDMAETASSKLDTHRRRSDVKMRRGSVTYRGSLAVV